MNINYYEKKIILLITNTGQNFSLQDERTKKINQFLNCETNTLSTKTQNEPKRTELTRFVILNFFLFFIFCYCNLK